MAEIIPLSSLASDTFNVVIEGISLRIRQRWNSREQTWRIDIFEGDDTPILQGLKLLANQNITKQYTDSRLPNGDFFFLDVNISPDKPTFDNIGAAQKLYFISQEEIDAAVQA